MSELVYADDLRVGETWELGERTLCSAEMIEFARQWDPQEFHLSEAAAANGFFGGIIASGVQTFAVYTRLAVDAMYSQWAVIAGRAVRNIEYLAPVRPGMTLHGLARIDGIEPRRSDRSLVTHTGILRNDEGIDVLTITLEAYVARRVAAPIEGQS